ncbi:MAG: thioredoxin family protein [Pirellulales bacterium]
MWVIKRSCLAGLMALAIASQVQAQTGGMRWETNLETARQTALQTNRLLVLHFMQSRCPACLRMEREVFSQPEAARALEANYVFVKVNVEHDSALAQQYAIRAVPCDVILTPQGQVVGKQPGAGSAPQYLGRLNEIAAAVRRPNLDAPPRARLAAEPPRAVRDPVQPSSAQTAPQARYAEYSGRPESPRAQLPPQIEMPVAQAPNASRPAPQMPATPPATAPNIPGLPPGSPPLGLDGYCPVQLAAQMQLEASRQRWVMGDRRWGVIHRGRTYLFSGPEEQKAFLANPDRYSPVMSGNDPVFALDYGQTVAGQRKWGVFYAGRVYLFANETSLKRFSENPKRYSAEVQQAMR